MKKIHCSSGFTLVELAIVLMIIGLLIGGVLRGQELMANARVTAIIQQAKAYEGAVTTFRDAYSALPGDMVNPGTRIKNCTSAICIASGNGDGMIGPMQIADAAPMSDQTSENRRFWVQLAAAGLISGVNPAYTGTPNAWGTDFPTTPFGGGFQIEYVYLTPGAYYAGRSNNFYVATRALGLAIIDANNQLIPVKDAARIDTKMDDGYPNSGGVWAVGGGANCYNFAAGSTTVVEYSTSQQDKKCVLGFNMD